MATKELLDFLKECGALYDPTLMMEEEQIAGHTCCAWLAPEGKASQTKEPPKTSRSSGPTQSKDPHPPKDPQSTLPSQYGGAQNSGKRKHTATNNVTQRAATWNDDREQEGEMCAAKKRKPNPKDEQTPLMPNIGATKFQIKIPRAVSWPP